MDTKLLRDTISQKSRDGRLGVLVELYRDGSGGNVIEQADSADWIYGMREVAKFNYGRICLVMHPTICSGYSEQHGIVISVVPGNIGGKLGEGVDSRRCPVSTSELYGYGDAGGSGFNRGDLSIHTNLEDAQRLYHHLGRVIRNAKRLSAKKAKKKAA